MNEEEEVSEDNLPIKEADLVNMAYISDATSFEEAERLNRVRSDHNEVEDLTGMFSVFMSRIMQGPVDSRRDKIDTMIREFMLRVEKFISPENKGISEEETPAKSLFELYNVPPTKTQDLSSGSGGIAVWKDVNGDYRWFAAYSNNFLDDDRPQEIISEKSHINFVDMVDSGKVPMPELWLWHREEGKCGVADMVDYSDGFAVATGTFDHGREHYAKNLSNMENLAVSHGMLGESLERDPNDSSIITRHITREISPLPAYAAANKRTAFAVLKGSSDMNDQKKKFLGEVGVDTDALDSALSAAKEEAEADGVPSKEATPEVEAQSETVEARYATMDEVAAVFAEVIAPFSQSISDIDRRLTEIDSRVKALSITDEEKIAQLKEETPAASLASMISGILAQKSRVSSEDPIVRSKPKETSNEVVSITGTHNPFLDAIVQDSMIGGA